MSDQATAKQLRGDALFLARLREGDDDAFDSLVQAYGASLIRYATGIVRSADLAQDVVQDVLLQLWRNRERIDASWDIAAYLYGQTRHRAIDVARSAQAQVQREERWSIQQNIESEKTTAIPFDKGEIENLREVVWKALSTVSPKCREVFMMVWDDELPYMEIARRMGLAEPTVRSYVSRALKQLVGALKTEFGI